MNNRVEIPSDGEKYALRARGAHVRLADIGVGALQNSFRLGKLPNLTNKAPSVLQKDGKTAGQNMILLKQRKALHSGEAGVPVGGGYQSPNFSTRGLFEKSRLFHVFHNSPPRRSTTFERN